ncbi:putative DEAD box ATP-dependent RNA helicase [Aspergillus pseudoustus]|uniref:ATP-dependent RNA helicase n=1 Tax=Aspergillus pseudoustus TaxID=1810923 RepID=A0ABR4K4P2_9EURO
MTRLLFSRVTSNTFRITRVPLAIRQNTTSLIRSTPTSFTMPPPNKRRKFKDGKKTSENFAHRAEKPKAPVQQVLPVAPSPVQASSPESETPRVPYATMAGKIDSNLLNALTAMGIETMSSVQHRVLTELPSLRRDCLVRAKTGEGKTIAFLLPVLQSLITGQTSARKGQVATLIITPTRELAQQIAKTCDELTAQLPRRIQCQIAVGGTARASAFSKFMNRTPEVLVATPGRLNDYLSDPSAKEKMMDIQTVILDEADTMLERGFLADVKEVLRSIPPKSAGWQGMCFSATLPPKVKDVVGTVLAPGYTSISTVDENATPTHERVPQYHVVIPSVADTFTTLTTLLRAEANDNPKIIVFGVTARMVGFMAAAFSKGLVSLPVFEIHSRLTQNARTKVTSQFKEASAGILFASDVVGRGMDFPNVDLVVQVGLPANAEQYVHRVGRTARAGKDGRAVILLTEAESYFIKVNKHLPIQQHPQAEQITSAAPGLASDVSRAMAEVDPSSKATAYSSYIGFLAGSGLLNKLKLDKPGLVQLGNELAIQGMGCPEPPPIQKKVVGKMGLKGVPGFNFAPSEETSAPRHRRRN